MSGLPARVGILGAGQLARMMALDSHGLGVRPFVYAVHRTDCAASVTSDVVFDAQGGSQLAPFCSTMDVLTIESEFLDLTVLEQVVSKTGVPLFPGIACLRKVQDKRNQKKSFAAAGIPTLPFTEIHSKDDFNKATDKFGRSLVLKQAKMGYDGKGTFIFSKDDFDSGSFQAKFPSFDGYAEQLARFEKEIAVVIARSATGEVKSFPVVETNQEGGICRWAVAPARVSPKTAAKALEIAQKVITSFDGVGVFGIEMFALENGEVVVNEIAPRVHNSGHFTMNACVTSQFEQHVRAILGMPLGDSSLTSKAAAMVNIIGKTDGAPLTETARPKINSAKSTGRTGSPLAEPGTWVHWYGKVGAVAGRKLGHVNAVAETVEEALAKARVVRDRIMI